MEPNIWIEIGKMLAPAIIVISVVLPVHHSGMKRIDDTHRRIDDSIRASKERIDDCIRVNKEQFQAFLEAWKLKD